MRTPTRPMRLNYANPLTENLVAFIPLTIPGYFVNLVSGDKATGVYPTLLRTVRGGTLLGSTSETRTGVVFGSTYLKFPIPFGISQLYNWSIAAGVLPSGDTMGIANTSLAIAALQLASGTDESGLALMHAGNGSVTAFRATTVNSSGSQVSASTANIASGRYTPRLVAVFRAAADRGLFSNRNAEVTNSGSFGTATPTTLRIGAWLVGGGGESGFYNEALEYVAVWNVAQTTTRVLEFNENPWQILLRNSFRTYSIPYSAPVIPEQPVGGSKHRFLSFMR